MEMSNIFLRFEDDAGIKDPLEIIPNNGFVPQSMTIAFPEVRDVVDKKPNANGTFDYTAFFGAGSVQTVIAVAPELTGGKTDRDLVDDLKGWMAPSRRTWIFYKYAESEEWRKIKVRASSANRPYSFVSNQFGMVSLAWRSVDGSSKGTTLVDELVAPGGSGESGITFDIDLTTGVAFPDSDPVGVRVIYNEGNLDVLPLIRIFGPCDQPRIENRTTGLKLEFLASYSILDGDYIDIDFDTGTVALNGDQSNSRYDQIDFSTSDWFPFAPGDNEFRYYPAAFTPPSVAEVIFLPNFL